MRLGSPYLGALVVLSLATGCLYTDTINAPPRAELELTDPNSATSYRRGDTISYNADKSFDPDDDALFYAFEAQACAENYCVPIDELAADRIQLSYVIPYRVGDPDSGPPTTRVRTQVTVTDGRGAFATTFEDEILDTEPRLTVQVITPGINGDKTFAVGQDVLISARVDGGELGTDDFDLEWTISTRPATSQTDQLTFEEQTGTEFVDPTYLLQADVTGGWEVTVTATDSSGASTSESEMLIIVGDQPACIVAQTPSVSFAHLLDVGDSPQTFEVLEVIDEFDPYPYDDESALEFQWMLSVNGGDFTPVGTDSSSFVFNPALYAPGDDVELRVEVQDATRATENWPACSSGEATCSEGGNSCTQRQTWSIGVR